MIIAWHEISNGLPRDLQMLNAMKENAIPRSTKDATKCGVTLFRGKKWNFCFKKIAY